MSTKDRDCIRVQSIVDEMLADDMPLFVAKHITSCSNCSQYTNKLNGLRRLLRDSHRVTVPDDFDVRLRMRLQDRSEQRRTFWAFVPTPALAALAIFVVTFSIVYALFRHPAPGSGTQTTAESTSAPIAKNDNPAAANTQADPIVASDVASDIDGQAVPVGRRNSAGAGIKSISRLDRSTASTTDIPGVPILLNGEQVMRYPQVVFGARRVVPRSSSASRLQTEPSTF
ncbi:MAG TPA: hypothetical protein VFC63_25380 [Blastocatellia bacterium]|nr:hypothetical protein [Blastocatellia bacterium]